jgi:hypothetical protein
MKSCPELEELLKEGSGGHAAHCRDCRELLEALTHVDATFDAAFGNLCATPELEYAIRARISRLRSERRPSILPEVLDLIGWAAVIAAVAIALPFFASLLGEVLAGIR